MYLTRREVISLDRAGLIELLSRRIPEGHHIDYKQALSGSSRPKQFTEFLKDTTAFANANGGHIIIGVKEPDGSTDPGDLMVGLEDGAELSHDLERLASGGPIDPRISGLIIQPVHINDNRWVIVVHIPPSMAKPHMVVYDKRTYLPQRHSESVQPMTSYDIRQAVLTSGKTTVKTTGSGKQRGQVSTFDILIVPTACWWF
ncbi:MAG: ATP-binding protein [Deltaproteobacteria bacterium]|nr:ATP-binding protein [Deltaproteobacteria bacterium]